MAELLSTSIGAVSIDARLDRGDGPAVLVVRGVWAPQAHLNELFERLADTDLVIGHLPGMWSPRPVASDPAAFSAAYDELVARLLPGRRVVAVGVSAGALVTLGLRSAEIGAHVLVEPFLQPAELWPLQDEVRAQIARAGAQGAAVEAYARQLLGLGAHDADGRDFKPLLDRVATPIHAVVGSAPLLPRRPVPHLPSLASPRTRAALAAHPRASLVEVPAPVGHDVTSLAAGRDCVADAIRRALADLDA